MDIVVYYRKRKRGRKAYGFNMDEQQSSVHDFCEKHSGNVLQVFTDIAPGGFPNLSEAVDAANRNDALLLIPAFYRIRVNSDFLRILESCRYFKILGTRITEKNLEKAIQAAEKWSLGHSKKIKEKLVGVPCGAAREGHFNKKNAHLREAGRKKATERSAEVRTENFRKAYAHIVPLLIQWRKEEYLQIEMVDLLNERGERTMAGKPFNAQRVSQIFKRLIDVK